jgi:hypothetical protein
MQSAYNLAIFLRTLALPEEIEHWSLTTLREKLVNIGHAGGAPPAPPRGTADTASCRLIEVKGLGWHSGPCRLRGR